MADRGISPVVGVILMIAITLLLASVFTVGIISLADLSDEEDQIGEILDNPTTSEAEWDGEHDLIPVKSPGDAPRTSGNDVLEFRIENTRDEQVTVEAFEVNATEIDSGIIIDDSSSAEEVEIRRVDQKGSADNGSDSFAGDGTQYHFVDDSSAGGQVAILDANEDDAEVDIREFSQDIGNLEFTDSESEADLIVTLILDDGSEHGFYFSQR